jgi:hypothetical protein
MTDRPRIENAPGLTWNKRKAGWEARWQARTDLVQKGWEPKSVRLWAGHEPTPAIVGYIQDRCNALQTEMLVWGRGGVPQIATPYDGTLKSLAECYQTDKDSNFRTLRFKTREHYETLLKKILSEHGDKNVKDIRARDVKGWHQAWMAPNDEGQAPKITMAHGVVGMLRTIINFGFTYLECKECERLSGVLHNMRFKMGKPREQRLTYEQVVAIIEAAHKMGLPSLALAQAFQWDCMIRQKDAIGEYVPISESTPLTDVIHGNQKWVRGLLWQEIDENLTLRHTTSKRDKKIEISLSAAPLVMQELARMGERPTSGPVIVFERKGMPYTAHDYRRFWRKAADMAGVPKAVRNMDSRSGAITEALLAGAPMDSVRKSATHATPDMTARYSRGDAAAAADVARHRVEYRNKKGQ